ncbi:hypothetical protein EV182_004629, partial [Spiromyces aspiralis]
MKQVQAPLTELASSVARLNQQLHSLSRINESLVTFNVNFGLFLQGLKLNSECMVYPEPHREVLEAILKELHASHDGMYMHEIMREVQGGLTRSRCTEYLNMLVREEHVIRMSRKGHLYLLNKDKHR